ncbi:hypothetical protein LXA43DRAFT_1068346, partial [Ganoderma leucocontextum]
RGPLSLAQWPHLAAYISYPVLHSSPPSKRSMLLAYGIVAVSSQSIMFVLPSCVLILAAYVNENSFICAEQFVVPIDAIAGSVDILLAATLAVVLVQVKSDQRGENRLVNKLIFLNVNLGIISTLWGFLALGLRVVYSSSSMRVLLYVAGAGTHSMSLLWSLNARQFNTPRQVTPVLSSLRFRVNRDSSSATEFGGVHGTQLDDWEEIQYNTPSTSTLP